METPVLQKKITQWGFTILRKRRHKPHAANRNRCVRFNEPPPRSDLYRKAHTSRSVHYDRTFGVRLTETAWHHPTARAANILHEEDHGSRPWHASQWFAMRKVFLMRHRAEYGRFHVVFHMSARNSSSLRLTSSGWSRVTQCDAVGISVADEPSFSCTFSAQRAAWNVFQKTRKGTTSEETIWNECVSLCPTIQGPEYCSIHLRVVCRLLLVTQELMGKASAPLEQAQIKFSRRWQGDGCERLNSVPKRRQDDLLHSRPAREEKE